MSACILASRASLQETSALSAETSSNMEKTNVMGPWSAAGLSFLDYPPFEHQLAVERQKEVKTRKMTLWVT